MSRSNPTPRLVRAQSGAPLGELPPLPEGALADVPRYEPGGLLGAGGMGEVRVAWDTRLGRLVAIKTAHPADPDGAARLEREARLTARLEHPHIVPVHDGGHDAEGRSFYTMRLLPGRSLAHALAAAEGLPGRLAWVRHVIDAAHAVAYAHSRGVLHRDLKPANILVGGFGETVVADWGLACTLDEAALGDTPGVGTPGFASPEQLAGRPVDGRSDVYGLGAVLHELLAGAPPGPELRLPPEAPPELAAITRRALSPDPADRYPDAQAFADDLLAWFEGRRVAAHAYSLGELVRRAVWTWRAPLAVAAVATLAVGAALANGWAQTARERDRAVAAETESAAARAEAQRQLGGALVGQARSAAADGRRIDAEVLAAHALALGPSPEARGVLARYGGRPAPTRLAHTPLPDCGRAAISLDRGRVACVGGSGLRVYDLAAPEAPLGTSPSRPERLAFSGGTLVYVIDDRVWAWSPPEAPRLVVRVPNHDLHLVDAPPGMPLPALTPGGIGWVDPVAGAWRRDLRCPALTTMATDAVALPDGAMAVACTDRTVIRLAPDGAIRVLARFSAEEGVVTHLGLDAGPPGRLAAVSAEGRIRVIDAEGGGVVAQVADDAVGALDIALHGDRVVTVAVDGTATVRAVGTGAEVARLPADGATLVRLADAGATVVLVGAGVAAWRVPDPERPHVLPHGAGVAAVAVSPDGGRVAAALGDGAVAIHAVESGALAARLRWQEAVAKDVAWSPDGRWLAAGTSAGAQRILAVDDWTRHLALPDVTFRRVAWLAGGWLLAAPYQVELRFRNLPSGRDVRMPGPKLVELRAAADGSLAVGVDRLGWVWFLTADEVPRLRRSLRVTDARAAVPHAGDALVATDDAVLRVAPDGAIRARWPTEGLVTDLDVSADGRWLGVAHLDGRATVVRLADAVTVARLEGHRGRLGGVAFAPDGRWLYTASWDETVRAWWLGELETPAEALVAARAAAWGRTLDEALAADQR